MATSLPRRSRHAPRGSQPGPRASGPRALRDGRISVLGEAGQDRRLPPLLEPIRHAGPVTGRLDVLIVGWMTDPRASACTDSLGRWPIRSRRSRRRFRTRCSPRSPGRACSRREKYEASPACVRSSQAVVGSGLPRYDGARRVGRPGAVRCSVRGRLPFVRIMVWQLVSVPFGWLPGPALVGRARAVATFTRSTRWELVLLLTLIRRTVRREPSGRPYSGSPCGRGRGRDREPGGC